MHAIRPARLLAAALAGLLLAVVWLATPAAATGAKLSQSAQATADCGEVTLTFTNNHAHHTKDFTYVWHVLTSDGQDYTVPVPHSTSPHTEVVTLDEGEGDGWVSYGVVAGPESDYYLVHKTVALELCEPEPTEEPSESEPATEVPTEPEPTESEPEPTEPTPTPTATPTPAPTATPTPAPTPTFVCPDGYAGIDLNNNGVLDGGDICLPINDKPDDDDGPAKPAPSVGDVTGTGSNTFTGGHKTSSVLETPDRMDLGGGGAQLASDRQDLSTGGLIALMVAALVVAVGGAWLYRRTM